MRARVISLIKEKGISLPGIGLPITTRIKIGQDISPEHGGGKVADMRIDGQLLCIYKQNPDGTPCKDFGCETNDARTPIVADGVAFPVAMCKSFLFVEDKDADSGAIAKLTAERDELAKQVEQLTAPKQGQKGK